MGGNLPTLFLFDMKKLQDLKDKIRSLDMQNILSNALKGNEKLLADLNRNQLSQGLLTNDYGIGEYQSKAWAAIRQAAGKQVGYVDLKFTGRMYQAIRADVKVKETIFSNNVEYFSSLSDRYDKGKDGTILGLNRSNMRKVAEDKLIPTMLIEIRKQLLK